MRQNSNPRPNGDRTAKYTWENIVYITNEETNEEITSYALPVELDNVRITPEMQNAHDEAVNVTLKDKTKWKSNTVIVVGCNG